VAAGGARRLDWHPGARRAFLETLARIMQDELIQAHPALGTPTPRRGERRFPVPNSGHVFHYRVTRDAIRIVLWYRARQRIGI
jgi:plasmid stabilization system protein ParE